VTGVPGQANYSSLRAGRIEFRRLCEQVQYGMLFPILVRPIADRFHQQGALLGLWSAEMPDGVSHAPPAHKMVDPLKDATAVIAQVYAGFVPQPEAAGAFGDDFPVAVEMIREANALPDKAGISLRAGSRNAAPRRTPRRWRRSRSPPPALRHPWGPR
jgi:capsid protein